MPTRNINLTDHFDDFVAAEIDAGRYRNASEVLRAGLRLLEQQKHEDEQKVATLRKLAKEGFAEIDQGLGIDLNGEEELRQYLAKIGRRAVRNVAKRAASNGK